MLELVTDEKDIRAAQAQLCAQLHRRLRQVDEYTVGFPGGSYPLDVHTSPHCPIWHATFLTDEKNRWINMLGLRERLNPVISNNIVVECNPEARGINRRTAGLFLREPTSGTFFLGHRGRVGGGQKGVGRDAFARWYRGN